LNVFGGNPEKVRKFLSEKHVISKVKGRAQEASLEGLVRVRNNNGSIYEFPDEVQELLKVFRKGDNRGQSSLMNIKPVSGLDYSNMFVNK
jgi:hypothetical protein